VISPHAAYAASSVAAGRAGAGGAAPPANRVTFNLIKARLGDLLYKITSQKFEHPDQGEDALRGKLAALGDEIRERFRALEEEVR